ncbi:uncharacterized protein DNG_07746 [Cephalotrichum gorgonifer]|uniref:LysM domain-containing protein n=1 Tax=Cephalotrichum gorgonifer TaxID=2041049 RepID=A0AAE8N274_9PEZI|nr:uncharacterized protein DNG_07746 [Cephalotrichum gorgonifer]
MSPTPTLLSTHDPDTSSIRPRNRRLISAEAASPPSNESSSIRGTARLASGSSTPRRDASPVPSGRLDVGPPEVTSKSPTRRGKKPAGGIGTGLLDGSWTASWMSVQDLAAGWLSGGAGSGPPSRRQYRRADGQNGNNSGDRRGAASRPWAQEPRAAGSRTSIQDVGAGVMAEREAALKVARMASVLESHDGVNGGLDVAGKFKLRTSDDISRHSNDAAATEMEEILAYIHHVRATDTYAGIILKYGCREDRFTKVNGLWSRDSISTRKWLALPVDACEVKGRPCAGPSSDAPGPVDLLAPTPGTEEDDYGWRGTTSTSQQHAEDIFGPSPTNGSGILEVPEEPKPEDPNRPWTHVRWVSIDSLQEPVEIGRISRRALGYFRPRRKKSLLSTMSPLSTPRPSLDVQSTTQASGDGTDDTGAVSSRRQSLLGGRPGLAGGSAGLLTPMSARSRMGSVGADTRPRWMRQPGGVGSMNWSARAPGPEKDPLNSWAKKHFPALIVDSSPSTSATGVETAQLGFPPEIGLSAEAPFREAADLSRQGTGLDRAAAAVETWLRGALAKRPGTPSRGGEWRGEHDMDLIELADTVREDGGVSGKGVVDSSLSLPADAARAGGSSGRAETSASRRGKNKDD